MMLLSAAAIFVGSQVCRPCHTALYDAYARTPMARSSGRADSLPATQFTAAGHRYSINGRTLEFDGGSARFDFFIGSNAAGRSFLTQRDGYLYEMPVTWYAQKQRWDASPGYQHDNEIRLTRAVEPGCLACHTSQMRPVRGTQNRYGDPPFLENGVACERCHGPGSEHAQNPTRAPMVNPVKLDAERRDAVCSQCHLTGEARVERAGRRLAEYRAGDRLSDFATYFGWQGGRRDVKATSHAEKLAASACKIASGDKLWCGTCHEPHTNEDRSQAACLGCHAGAHRQKERCVSCHMPRTTTADANHGMMTDHGIPRVPPGAGAKPAGEGALTPLLGAADERAFGLAYAELGDRRAREYLLKASPQDWLVRLRLAATETDPRQAAAHYEAVLRENPAEPAALVNLGTSYARQGRVAEAAALWERALTVNPLIEEAVLNLSQLRPPKEARALLERYLAGNPVSRAARRRLAEISRATP